MNCISIAISPLSTKAAIKRVIEYFYPGEGDGEGKIWADIFVDNPTEDDLTLRVLHAGSLTAEDVTEDSWVREHAEKDHCAAALTKRIGELHDKNYYPIDVEHSKRSIWLDRDEYHAWAGGLMTVIGDDPSLDVPFTLWEIKPVVRGKSVLRLRLEMREPTYRRRFADKRSFFAYGEAIVLRNIEDGALPSYTGPDAGSYREEFANFKRAHKVPEAFEYLIVSPDEKDLPWDAVALSALISPKFIRSGALARTTRWFATDSPNTDGWELKADFVLEVIKLDKTQQPTTSGFGEPVALPRDA
jgi:hypothetical protein